MLCLDWKYATPSKVPRSRALFRTLNYPGIPGTQVYTPTSFYAATPLSSILSRVHPSRPVPFLCLSEKIRHNGSVNNTRFCMLMCLLIPSPAKYAYPQNRVLYAPLAEIDPEVQNIIDKETWRQFTGLELIASEVRYRFSVSFLPRVHYRNA